MSQNGQAHFKNLAVSDHFGTLWIKSLNDKFKTTLNAHAYHYVNMKFMGKLYT